MFGIPTLGLGCGIHPKGDSVRLGGALALQGCDGDNVLECASQTLCQQWYLQHLDRLTSHPSTEHAGVA
ncbi:hypothetical protein GUJ93_ZPchr0003g17439 [Zizania palustris]|uniref:Uncharacterized protein n=1 Tax=Zizania palustris TaxID=103762 RepID=A0A8J5VXD5_ZIZPA|nr:hypothetical protein GUJ93_ZPchr0003g17439 [Zizania palustris]